MRVQVSPSAQVKKVGKIIVVLGQTATGKSAYAVELARKIGGEIVSADSRQVYKGLDLGTGKITKKEMRGVPHHLLDVVSPKTRFSVADYKKMAEEAIDGILARGKTPILVGGTGFYIEAVVDGVVTPPVAPNAKLREKLAKVNTQMLFAMLKKIDPKRAKSIDARNPVRLIRAIEIATSLGKVPTKKSKPKYNAELIGIAMSDELLKERIAKRLKDRVKSGMITEVQRLHAKGISWKRMHELGLEYRFIAEYLQKKISKTEMIETIEKEIWHYAKRQKTWFKRDKRINWF